ncbi:MAG: VOC family protein [Chloroflexota bacterium]
MLKRFDHLAIAVRDTEAALKLYRDKLGLPVLFSQEHPDQPLLMTHLDMGNAQLQLIQPLTDDHPVARWLDEHGEGLHHVCFYVDDVAETFAELPAHGLLPMTAAPGGGPNGRSAGFIDPATTNRVMIELTSDPDESEA